MAGPVPSLGVALLATVGFAIVALAAAARSARE
jgi:hypothetical protein